MVIAASDSPGARPTPRSSTAPCSPRGLGKLSSESRRTAGRRQSWSAPTVVRPLNTKFLVWRLGAPPARRLIERFDLRGGQAERERARIVGRLLGILRSRNGNDPSLLEEPPERNLSRLLLVCVTDLPQQRHHRAESLQA